MFILSAIVGLLIIYLLTNERYRWIYILYKTLPRDIRGVVRYIKLSTTISKFIRNEDTVAKIFDRLVKKHPKKIIFYYEDESWTFEKLEEFSNQIANYFKSIGYKKGDSISLLLENRPEYVGIWLGLSKIGVVTALINTNLVSEPLVHSITVSQSRGIIYGSDFSKAVADINEQMKELEHYELTMEGEVLVGSLDLMKSIKNQPTNAPADMAGLLPHDKLLYIYTSGTTGLPKAAVISNTRYMYAAVGTNSFANFSSNDIFYNPLPLYHTAGGMLAIGQAVIFGLTVALRKKFSASNYWSDCKKYNCTVANYIGEICRYLLAVHKPGNEVDHNVQKIIGNGLRPQIWQTFVDTFKIANVCEFYGSTEGNCNLMNMDNQVGSVGFVPRYADFIHPVILIRCDKHTSEPIRNKLGFFTQCKVNEAGVLIGKINQNKVQNEFGGYADQKATQKKLLRDVFRKGDMYFNTGDILLRDELGYYYFKDRTGDTFRWKGENVATSEVEAIINTITELKDAVVYGVQIPGTEGRAGMAAIVDADNSLDIEKLAKGLKSKLPGYAIPVFLRIMDTVPITGTFKLKKVDLQKEGYDCNNNEDNRLYFYDTKSSEYIPLTKEKYDDIVSGRMKL